MATIQQLHTYFHYLGNNEEEKRYRIYKHSGGRTTSSKQLTTAELDDLCNKLKFEMIEKNKILDKKRKRLIGCVFGVFKKMNKQVSMEYVKGLICRAAKVDDTNKIPSARLDSLYNAFLNAQKDLDITGRLVGGHILEQQNYN